MLNLILPLALTLFAHPLKADTTPFENEADCKNRVVKIDIDGSGSAARDQAFTDLSYYILNGLSPDKSCRISGTLEVTCAVLHVETCARLPTPTSSVTYEELREYYQTNHLKTVEVRKHETYIKPTLTEFSSATNFHTWERQVVNRSGVKRKTRVIFRSPADFPQQISVSETLDTDDGNLNATKLETEIAVRRIGGERTFEFYTYDKNGDLAHFSEFPAGERPSPTVCVACHYNPGLRTVSRFIPE
jgi:hypothetical protein